MFMKSKNSAYQKFQKEVKTFWGDLKKFCKFKMFSGNIKARWWETLSEALKKYHAVWNVEKLSVFLWWEDGLLFLVVSALFFCSGITALIDGKCDLYWPHRMLQITRITGQCRPTTVNSQEVSWVFADFNRKLLCFLSKSSPNGVMGA